MLLSDWSNQMGPYSNHGEIQTITLVKFEQAHMCMVKLQRKILIGQQAHVCILIGQSYHGEIQINNPDWSVIPW